MDRFGVVAVTRCSWCEAVTTWSTRVVVGVWNGDDGPPGTGKNAENTESVWLGGNLVGVVVDVTASCSALDDFTEQRRRFVEACTHG